MAATIEAGRQAKTQSEIVVSAEKLGYAAIVLVAAVLRFWNLAAAPLTTNEAAQALAAWKGMPLPAGGSPLWYALNQVLFGIFGANVNDVGVRLGPALIGTLLVLLPWLWRRQLGAIGALAAAAMLAISPSLVFASRLLDGQIVVATCALATIGFALRVLDEPRPIYLIGLGVSIGLVLTSGPGLITLLVIIAPAAFVVYRWIATEADRARVQAAMKMWRTVLVSSAVTFFGVATVALLRPTTLSSVPEMVTAWLHAWSETGTIGAGQIVQVLFMYEPLILVSGIIGLGYGLRRLTGLTALLAVWFIGTLLIALLQPGRQPWDVILALIPLALLGGVLIDALITDLRRYGSWQAEGFIALIAVPLVGYLAIMGSSYAAGNTLVGLAQFLGIRFDAGGSYFVLVIMAGLIGGGIGALVFGLKAMLRGALSVVLIVCALISLSNAWGVTQVRPSDPRELLWGPTATALDVRDMVTAIEAASVRNTGFSRQSSLTYALPQDDPVLRWYLRRFLNVTDSVIPNLPSTVIVTPEGVQPSVPGTNYVGAKFPVRTVWDQLTLPPENWLKWWLYRETPQPVNVQETIVIWVQPK